LAHAPLFERRFRLLWKAAAWRRQLEEERRRSRLFLHTQRLSEIGFDDLGMLHDILWRSSKQLLPEIEYEDVIAKVQDNLDEVLDHHDRRASRMDPAKSGHQVGNLLAS